VLELDFKIMPPLDVTETEITTSTPDAENDVYAGGTNYAEGDLVWYSGNVWRSLQGSNTGNTPVEGAWWTDLGEVDQGADVYASGTTYAENDYAVYQGQLWKSAIASNTGNTPDAAGTEWTLQGATNRLKAFDGFIQDGATQAVSINAESGEAASVGQIVFGSGLALGSVKVGTSVGIESYSIKDRDDFNRSLVVARPYSDTVDFDLAVDTERVGYIKRQLALRDAMPTVFYMSGGAPYGAIAYGFFQNFDILHSTPVVADCVLEIEGLG